MNMQQTIENLIEAIRDNRQEALSPEEVYETLDAIGEHLQRVRGDEHRLRLADAIASLMHQRPDVYVCTDEVDPPSEAADHDSDRIEWSDYIDAIEDLMNAASRHYEVLIRKLETQRKIVDSLRKFEASETDIAFAQGVLHRIQNEADIAYAEMITLKYRYQHAGEGL